MPLLRARRPVSTVLLALCASMAPPVWARAAAPEPEGLREAPASSEGSRRPAREMKVALRLGAEDERVEGRIVSWDHRRLWLRPEAGEGAVRVVAWAEVDAFQAYEIRRRLIDVHDARDWLELGVAMLRCGAPNLADRAFAVAERRDPTSAAAADSARALHASGRDADGALAPAGGPAAAPGPSIDGVGASISTEPWPALTEGERAAEVERLKRVCSERLEEAGLRIQPIETEHFLLYSDSGRGEARRWARELERMHTMLLTILGMPRDTALFNGKCVVFLFETRERYVEFEASAFGFVAKGVGGVCHLRGPDVFVSFYRAEDPVRFHTVLIHEAVHALIYRYRSPINLPTWANEGLADYVAGRINAQSPEPAEHWRHARLFVDRGGDPGAVLGQSYTDGTWYTKDSYPVSHMMVRFMLKHRPRQFKEWIDDVKAGADWRESLTERFGVTPEALAEGFARDIAGDEQYSR